MSLKTDPRVKKGEESTPPWENDPWGKPLDTTTTTTAEDFDEAQATIQRALYGDGVYKQETARKNTITYTMIDGTVVSEEKAKGYINASFILEVNHKKDGTVDIIVTVDNRVVTTTRHWIKRILQK